MMEAVAATIAVLGAGALALGIYELRAAERAEVRAALLLRATRELRENATRDLERAAALHRKTRALVREMRRRGQ